MTEKKREVTDKTRATNVGTVSGSGTIESAELICTCHEPAMEKIVVEQVLGAEMAQRVVEFDMIVPTVKPDIEQVIDVYVKNVEVTSIDVIHDKVIVRGDLEVKVMYVADLPNQPVHAFEKLHVRFTRDIVIDGAKPDMTVTADIAIEFVDYCFDEEEKRKVRIIIVLKVWARVVACVEIDAYALTPIDQIGEIELAPGSTVSASDMNTDSVSASALGGGEIEGFGVSNVLVSSPVTPTAGKTVSVAGVATVTGTTVNVRTGPGTNFPVLTKVNKGATVTVLEQAFGWYRVVLADNITTGWIAGWLLSLGTANG